MLAITKTGPTQSLIGKQMTYTIAISNLGTSAATGVKVNDTLPIGLTYVSSSREATSGNYA